MTINKFIILAFLTFVVLSDISAAKVVDSIVAKVNGDIITLIELENYINAMENINKENSTKKTKKIVQREKEKILNKIIEEKLLLQYAKQHHIEPSKNDIDNAIEEIKNSNKLSDETLIMMLEKTGLNLERYRTRLKNQIGLSKVLNREIKERIKLNENEISSYYNKNKKNFFKSDEVKVRHILFLVDDKMDIAKVRTQKRKAQRTLKMAKRGDNFEELAKNHSEGPTRELGGEMGWIKKGTMIPSFEKAAFSIKKGIVGHLVKTKYGYHIIKVEGRKRAKIKTLDETKDVIRGILFKQKYDKRYNNWIAELKKNSFIEVYIGSKSKKIKSKKISRIRTRANKKGRKKTKISEKNKIDLKPLNTNEIIKISKFILAWENAQETKNRKQYFSFYSKGFEKNGMKRKKWEKSMEKEYEKYKFIKVEIRKLRVHKRSNFYIATFDQRIKSNIDDQITLVRLYLTKNKKGLKIAQEKWIASPYNLKEFSKKPLLTLGTIPKAPSRPKRKRSSKKKLLPIY